MGRKLNSIKLGTSLNDWNLKRKSLINIYK
jgi:hypothetical protein